MNQSPKQHAGIVTIVGRPNSGKSTLLNRIIGIKVAITSPLPQTTRFPIRAVLNEPRGQIVFVDTPGVLGKHEDTLSASISQSATQSILQPGDVLLYVVDVTRPRGLEENRIIGLVRPLQVPKVIVFNKIDQKKTSYRHEYDFLIDEFDRYLEISALEGINIDDLVTTLFDLLPEQEPLIPLSEITVPILNLDRRLYLEELIREKVYLFMYKEIPYSTTVRVNTIEDKNELLVIDADVVTSSKRYKGMIIGQGGEKIKQIGQAVRKELESTTQRKVFINLEVVVDPHWMQEWL
jgi:GTP-binding protein Era